MIFLFLFLLKFSTGYSILHALLTWVHGRGLRPLQPRVSLLAARRAQRVKALNVNIR